MRKCAVSVIVPVYNVENYIDACMESIIDQTFSDIEVLLIMGQSSDFSAAKCNEWCLKDRRIRMVKEKQRGLALARYQGIQEAKGEYIVFVDSDDVIKPTYIEKLYNKIVANHADMAECDYIKIRILGENEEYIPCTEILKKELNISQKLLLGSITMWKIMTRRDIWLDNNIMSSFPVAEDFSTYPILLFTAKKIVNVSEALYIYQKYSTRSRDYSYATAITSSEIAKAMVYVLEECIKRDYFDTYKTDLEMYILRWISRYCSPCISVLDYKEYTEMKQIFLNVFGLYFDLSKVYNEIVLGGFNLSRIVNKLPLLEDPYCRVNFTSIISIMSKSEKNYKVYHKNKYRKFMLTREYNEDFFQLVEKQKPKYFFFDLLEERYDILEINGSFFTKSEAFDEAEIDLDIPVNLISRESLECKRLWEESCVLFFRKLLTYVEPSNIIMVKNFLTEQYGDGENKFYFCDINKIRKSNNLLRNYYQFIEHTFPDIQVVNIDPNDKYYYTDINYEFGCFPWNLNEWENIEIAKKIML